MIDEAAIELDLTFNERGYDFLSKACLKYIFKYSNRREKSLTMHYVEFLLAESAEMNVPQLVQHFESSTK